MDSYGDSEQLVDSPGAYVSLRASSSETELVGRTVLTQSIGRRAMGMRISCMTQIQSLPSVVTARGASRSRLNVPSTSS